jgi:hypothetical protein
MRCKGKTKLGKRCANLVGRSAEYCHLHVLAATENKVNAPDLRSSRALFYPFIEINDEAWLKTQCLYWNTISTIVPAGMKCYTAPTPRYLQEAKILNPFHVSPDSPAVQEAAGEVSEYLETREGRRLVFGRARRNKSIHVLKFAAQLRRVIVGGDRTPGAKRILRIAATGSPRGKANSVRVPRSFANYYMTLLATCISRTHGYSILTSCTEEDSLACREMLGETPPSRYSNRVPSSVAEGVLAHLMLRTVALGPRTPVKKLVKFREKHSALLGRLRAATRELVSGLSGEVPPEALKAHLETLHSDSVVPALEELTGRLRDHRITCGYNNLKISTLASASPTVLGTALAATAAGPFALVAGVGLSVVLSIANYRVERRELLRSSPYAFLALAHQRFGRSQ